MKLMFFVKNTYSNTIEVPNPEMCGCVFMCVGFVMCGFCNAWVL
jgi:hypothetical protein